MTRKLTQQERETFLAEPRVSVVSIAREGGRPPLTVPSWYGYEQGGNITFFTGTQGRKARRASFIEQAGALSITVQHDEFPYKYVTVEGTIVQIDRPPSEEQMLAVLRRYLPDEMAQGFANAELTHPNSKLVLYTVRPDRWLTADFSDAGE